MTAFKMFDAVTALVDKPTFGVRAGDVGAIVEIFEDGAFEVDFSDQGRDDLFTAPMRADQIQAISERQFKQAA
jgi:hypothetical protein